MSDRSPLHAWRHRRRRAARSPPVPVMQGVFLDRDGTIIEEVGYLDRVERVALYPSTIDAVRVLHRARSRDVTISDQSGGARAFFPAATAADVPPHVAPLLHA